MRWYTFITYCYEKKTSSGSTTLLKKSSFVLFGRSHLQSNVTHTSGLQSSDLCLLLWFISEKKKLQKKKSLSFIISFTYFPNMQSWVKSLFHHHLIVQCYSSFSMNEYLHLDHWPCDFWHDRVFFSPNNFTKLFFYMINAMKCLMFMYQNVGHTRIKIFTWIYSYERRF